MPYIKHQGLTRNSDSLVFRKEDKPFNESIEEWSIKWWQWVLSISKHCNPCHDMLGNKSSQMQADQNVWFLGTTFNSDPVERKCKLPAGKAILFPIINFLIPIDQSSSPESVDFEQEMKNVDMSLYIDDNELYHLKEYRVKTHTFKVYLPVDNILQKPEGEREFFSDGYWIMLKSLTPGVHMIKWEARKEDYSIQVKYNLVINGSVEDRGIPFDHKIEELLFVDEFLARDELAHEWIKRPDQPAIEVIPDILEFWKPKRKKTNRDLAKEKFDPFLYENLQYLYKNEEDELFIIVEFNEPFVRRKPKSRLDRTGRHRETTFFELVEEKRSLIGRNSRVVHENLEVIPAMCVQAKIRDIREMALYDFVKKIELSTKARTLLYDAIAITHCDQLPKNMPSKHSIIVSIIDTGINEISPLKGKIKGSLDLTWEGPQDTFLYHDHHGHYEHGHGTSVASIINYIAPNVRFINYKSIHPFVSKLATSPDKANVIKSISESMKNDAEIINLSIGFDPSQCPDGNCDLCKAVDNAVGYGLSVIAAMGNGGKSPPDCPAQSRKAISVSASTKSDTIWQVSSKGPTTDGREKPNIVAPGRAIMTHCTEETSESRGGTSFAAAFVTGVIALYRQITTDHDMVQQAIERTAVQMVDRNTKQVYGRQVQGNGRIDVKNGYDYIINHYLRA